MVLASWLSHPPPHLALLTPHCWPGVGARPPGAPLNRLRFWGLTSLPPTLPIIGTKAAEREASQRLPKAKPGPAAPLKSICRPRVAGPVPYSIPNPNEPGLASLGPSTPKRAPWRQWPGSRGHRTLSKVAGSGSRPSSPSADADEASDLNRQQPSSGSPPLLGPRVPQPNLPGRPQPCGPHPGLCCPLCQPVP